MNDRIVWGLPIIASYMPYNSKSVTATLCYLTVFHYETRAKSNINASSSDLYMPRKYISQYSRR